MKSKYVYLLFIFLLIPFEGSTKNICGVYGNKKQPQDYYEIKSDGSFFLKEKGQSVIGTYKINRDIVTFILVDGRDYRARIKHNAMIDERGEVWVLWPAGKTGLDYEKAHIDISKSVEKIRQKFDSDVREGKITRAQADEQYEMMKKQVENSVKAAIEKRWNQTNEKTVSPDKSNRDAMIEDLKTYASLSQQYYKKPLSLGGGGNSFIGFFIPDGLVENVNGFYSVDIINDEEIRLTGVGKVKGKDGNSGVSVTLITGRDKIIRTIINN